MRKATHDALLREREREAQLRERIERGWRTGQGVRFKADDIPALRRMVKR